MAPPPQLKVVVLGDSLTGKTSLCHFLENPCQPLSSDWPCGVEYFHYEANLEPPLEVPVEKSTMTVSNTASSSFSTASLDRIRIQLVDQSGVDRYSLQPIVFRKAVGVIIAIDAPMLYREFMAENASRFHMSTPRTGTWHPDGPSVTPPGGQAACSSSPLSTSGNMNTAGWPSAGRRSSNGSGCGSNPCSSRYLNATAVGWDTYLKELILMWKTIVAEESQFARDNRQLSGREKGGSNPLGSGLPCFVFFTKCDLLPHEDEEQSVTAFRSECRMVCLQHDLRVDSVFFIGLEPEAPCAATSDVLLEARQGVAVIVATRVAHSKNGASMLLGHSKSKRGQQPVTLLSGSDKGVGLGGRMPSSSPDTARRRVRKPQCCQ